MQEQARNRYHQEGGKEKAKEYYKNNKERLQEQARNKYGGISNEERDIKRGYVRMRYRNMSVEDKNKLKEFLKNIAKN